MLRVATWNVLHRIHAENWEGELASRWPQESERIAAITERIAALDERVIALQEVSGDQLENLRGLDRTVVAFRYPRIPRSRRGSAPLRDPAEYLVTLVAGEAREVAAEAFAQDPGKGLLAVDVGGTLIINTHVTYGPERTAQLARLTEVARGNSVVLGDFNADREAVLAGLGPAFVPALPREPALPTRPRTGGTKATTIDHIFVCGAAPGPATVIDTAGLSDHNLVVAQIVL